MTTDEDFRLPPSPFEAEKKRLGEGFLAPKPVRSRSKPDKARPPFQGVMGGRSRPRLTDQERRYIGSTTGPRQEIARRFGIGEEWVTELRRRYRYEK